MNISKQVRHIWLVFFACFGLIYTANAIAQPTTSYICPPCGCNYDGTKSVETGRCPDCNMKLIAKGKYINYGPKVSPDGTKIAFLSTRDDDLEIYVMNADGTDARRLTKSKWEDEHISWSPDGNKIAFTSLRNDRTGDIYVMNSDGSKQTNLTNSLVRDFQPAFSPGGKHIVYASRREKQTYISLMDANGKNGKQLTHNKFSFQPGWSTDGKKIIYFIRREGTYFAFQMNIDGSSKTEIKNLPRNSAISPDGSKIVFSTRTSNKDYGVFLINADGSGKKKLVHTPGFDNRRAVWSPDGSQIFFNSDRDGQSEIYVMNTEGKKQRRITFQ